MKLGFLCSGDWTNRYHRPTIDCLCKIFPSLVVNRGWMVMESPSAKWGRSIVSSEWYSEFSSTYHNYMSQYNFQIIQLVGNFQKKTSTVFDSKFSKNWIQQESVQPFFFGKKLGPKMFLLRISYLASWWFQICFMFIPIWGRFPIWLICFKWVETTNQLEFFSQVMLYQQHPYHPYLLLWRGALKLLEAGVLKNLPPKQFAKLPNKR